MCRRTCRPCSSDRGSRQPSGHNVHRGRQQHRCARATHRAAAPRADRRGDLGARARIARTPLLVAELDYARHPRSHEGTAARYGAIIGEGDPPTAAIGPAELIDIDGASLDVVRLLGDGRSSFVVRIVDRPDKLVCFERTREYESSAVHLATNGNALVVQRLSNGWIRLTTPHRVATWDGIAWNVKPLSHRLVEQVLGEIGPADETLVANLLELCTHWLGAGRIGTSIVWHPGGDARRLGHLGFNAAVDVPSLDLRNRNHFAAILNALSQFDRAALVDADGHIDVVGVQLWASETLAPLDPVAPRHAAHLRPALLRRRARGRRVRRLVQRDADGVPGRPAPRARLSAGDGRMRTDPVTGATVEVVATRQHRPNLPTAGCPFCVGGLESPAAYDLAGVARFVAAGELGGGVLVNPVDPLDAAARLRAAG